MTVTFMELENHHCRFPVAEDAFCGKIRPGVSPYCVEHHHLCYIKGTASRAQRNPVMLPGEKLAPSKAMERASARLLDAFETMEVRGGTELKRT